jgi:hypothetical protein
MKITDDIVIAYVDGLADAETRTAVEAAMTRDGSVRRRVEAHRRLRRGAAGDSAPSLSEASPERALASANGQAALRSRPAEVVDLAAVRAQRTRPKSDAAPNRAWIQWVALGACVVAGVIMARGLAGAGASPMIADRHGVLFAEGPLARALDQQITDGSAPANPAARIGITFQAGDKSLCRTFQTVQGEGLAGLACRLAGAWRVRAVAEAVAPANGNRAGAPMPSSIAAEVSAIIVGSPLDPQAEAVARAKDWRE